MSKVKYTFASALLVTASTAVVAADLSSVPSGTYQVDPTHAYISFQYNHLGLSNPTLTFDEFTVDLNLDSADPTNSMIRVDIDANSVVAGSDIWKEHITGEDFFDVANHPSITYESTSIEAAGEGMYKLMGNLTIKGESKPVALDVTINAAMNHPMSGKPVVGLDATGSALRSDFGIDKVAPHVSDEVALNISVEMNKSE